MSEPHTWHELLAKIIKNPQEKERIATALGIHPLTLTRWVRSEATPHQGSLHRLFEAVPELRPLLADELRALSPPLAEVSQRAIPVTFYSHILELYRTSLDDLRCWPICTAVLHEACNQLAPSEAELGISVVRCMAPSQGSIIRCLQEYVGLNTFHSRKQVEQRVRFFGAESLAGYVVANCHSVMIADLNSEQRLPHQLPEQACSAAAFPLLHANRIAGCLLIWSTEPGYFRSPALLDLFQSYAALLALAFDPEDFYEPRSIALEIMPSLQAQQTYLVTNRQYIKSLLGKAAMDRHTTSYSQAEQRAWWQLAEELLHLSSHLAPEI